MKTLQKNWLCILYVLYSVASFAQKNEPLQQVNYCPSSYTAALLFENEIAIESNQGSNLIAAPLFSIQIKNAWGIPVEISSLRFSFNITNLRDDQSVDFESFNYLDESYISENYNVTSNNNGYNVEYHQENNSSNRLFLVDDRSGVLVINILDRITEFFRGSSPSINQQSPSDGFQIEVKNIYFKSAVDDVLEVCAQDVKRSISIKLPQMQKQITNADAIKKQSDQNLLEVNFYPNPATDFVQIAGNANDINFLQFYDVEGHLLFKRKLEANSYVDVRDLKKGMYCLILSDEKGQEKVMKRLLIN